MSQLYRGVSEDKHKNDRGRLIPRGDTVETVMRRDDLDRGAEMNRDGTFQRVPSDVNTARGHQLVSGIHNGCFISTTENFQIAVRFATHEGTVDGIVYVLDQTKFASLGIVSKKFPDPRYPDEEEVSIRAADGGEIPQEIIVGLKPVSRNDYAP